MSVDGSGVGRSPLTDAEALREVVRRIEALESAQNVRAGGWVLGTQGADLVATAKGRRVVLSDPALSPGAGPVRVTDSAVLAALLGVLFGDDCASDFVSGLGELGTGDNPLTQLGSGLQAFVDQATNLLLCGAGDKITPARLLDMMTAVLTPIASNPLAQMLHDFGDVGGPAKPGQFLLNVVAGATAFVARLLGMTGAEFRTLDDVVEFWQGVIDRAWHVLSGLPAEGGKTITHVLDSLADGWAKVWQWIQGVVRDLNTGTTDFVKGIQHAMIDAEHSVQDFFGHLAAGLGGNPWNGQTHSITDVWDAAMALFGKARNADQKATDAFNVLTSPRVHGSWVADLTDDVVFGSALIDGWTTPALGQAVVLPITVHIDRPIEAVKVAMKPPTMTRCLAKLFTVDRATGAATVWRDLGDIRPHLSGTAELKIIPVGPANAEGKPDSLAGAAEQLVYLVLVQLGGTATAMASWSRNADIVTGLHPKSLGMRYKTTVSTALPDAMVDADLLGGTPKIWGALGLLTPQTAREVRDYADDFNTINLDPVTKLPKLWNPRIGSLSYNDKRNITPPDRALASVAITQTSPSYQDLDAGVSTYRLMVATPNHMTGFTVWWLNRGGVTGNTVVKGAGMVRGNGSGPGVWGVVTYDPPGKRWTLQVMTGTAYDPAKWVQRARQDLPFANYPDMANDWRMVAQENSYVLEFRRGTGDDWYAGPSWVDLAGTYPYTEANTETGLATLLKYSAIDNYRAKDL